MELSDLPARELARLDAVCLEFESRLRESLHASLADGVSCRSFAVEIDSVVDDYGGEHASLLRRELDAIAEELHREQVGRAANGRPSKVKANNSTVPTGGGDAPTHAALTQALDTESISDTDSVSLPTLGDRIGPYFITSVLGRGGMGIVYRATDTRLDRSVAIKMLSLRGRQSQSLIERFQREAKAVAGLTHPHIVELFDIGVYDGMPYVVMEHLRGETLLERLRADRIVEDPVSTDQVRNWGMQLAAALATAHAQGVIHRDIKPENVMVMDRARPHSAADEEKRSVNESDSSLKLFDFGLSRVGSSRFESETELAGQSNLNLAELLSDDDTSTRIGMILGTPGYMAPEQARGGVITPAADIFSLGCVLFEAMFARPAFSGETATQRFAAVLEKQPIAEPLRRREDAGLAELILAMLDKEPSARPVAADVLASLQAGWPGGGSSASAAGDTVVISRRRLIEMVGGAAFGGAIGTFLLPDARGRELQSIRSLGVLRFVPSGTRVDPDEDRREADRELDQADKLSGLIANELSRLEGITVPKYESLTADEPKDFREVAKRLEVDALVSGTFAVAATLDDAARDSDPSRQKMTVNVNIVSGATGKMLEAFALSTAAGDNLIEQAALAQKIADAIDQELKQSDERAQLKNPQAFTCLIKGRTLSNPDTSEAMETALACFKHAISIDDTYPQAHAGIALTAISLAARVNDQRATELIALSQDSTKLALALAPENREARLARAMLDYQVLADFDRAAISLNSLTHDDPNHWQIFQQAAWLKMIQADETQAIHLMRRAVGLHPTSWFMKAELARAEWFRGNTERAGQSATVLLGGNKVTSDDELFPRGLLVDIHEQSGDLAAAARVDAGLDWNPTKDAESYFVARQQRLRDLPYGPFGPTINAAILQLRRTDLDHPESHDALLSRLIDAQLPMLPLVLCRHAAMKPIKHLKQATETFSVLRFV